MNEKEKEVYEMIVSYRKEHGYSPTIREMAKALGVRSTSTMHERVERMVFKGFLTKGPGARTILPNEGDDD